MWRRLGWWLGVALGLLNVVVALHAWRFTHFSAEAGPRTVHAERLPTTQKIWLLLTGFRNPKPVGVGVPAFPVENVALRSPNGTLAAWYGAVPQARGTVVLCHGYTSDKSRLRPEAAYFRQLGYAVLLLDFSGNGASEGYQTTIGYREAADVVAASRWAQARLPGAPLVLYGVSMGAVAIMRAESELGLRPAANILACPYGSMLQTARNRFTAMGLPPFPLANLLVLWGGLENNYWAFGLKAEEYARHIATPTLLLWGTADRRVTRAETNAIFAHLAGPKQRLNFVGAGHEPYWHRQPAAWRRVIAGFLCMKLR
ncbi:alpha/beta fold hydrolase [Hymenobacter sp. HMF4947]|uniref:Alpha/beta fold hydrolase n=1 Tax=Hymenobacter ginkgonis TaxID=2682976 RepID=A0A7K1TAA0_9BACT|nr:alpha/beta fold hydrolase [Hymenobacter ginkgonis]MVN75328.1 alpha/beta fold hydrolase [Hymenobacter ginkgonis]